MQTLYPANRSNSPRNLLRGYGGKLKPITAAVLLAIAAMRRGF